MNKFFVFTLVGVLLSSCALVKSKIPQPKREFRGVWVATVVNIDWPKNGNDTAQKQQEDFLDILDFYELLNYNAVIVQVRAAGDAFYKSDFAPWSRFLTGEEGKPAPWKVDNLAWMIQETHRRGMEFHAWLNPYRATFDMNTDILSNTHDFCTQPAWMIPYGTKYYYNPGLPEVRAHFTNIISELVTTYDIDGIHFDDYFYPYKIKDAVFDDAESFETYAQPNQALADWRRSNIDSLVHNTHQTINATKPWVQFGVSPFGVWKNNSTDPLGSDTKAGQTTYEDLYADPLLWMKKGWIDYLAPQVYWSMDLPAASHKKLVAWWAENNNNTEIYIGNGAYKVRNNSDLAWDNKQELPDQLTLARKTPEVRGNILFSAKSLMQNNPDVVQQLKEAYYHLPALTPMRNVTKTINTDVVKLKSVMTSKNGLNLNFSGVDDKAYALIYKSRKRGKTEYPMKKMVEKIDIRGTTGKIVAVKNYDEQRRIAITFLDRYGKESLPYVIDLKKTVAK